MAEKVDEARELSRAIQRNEAGPFLSKHEPGWKVTSEQAWRMSVGDAEVVATVKQRSPNGAPELVKVEAKLPGRLEQLGQDFSVVVWEFGLADVGLS
jgi:hypothetical protein